MRKQLTEEQKKLRDMNLRLVLLLRKGYNLNILDQKPRLENVRKIYLRA